MFRANPLINIIANGEWHRANQMIQDNGDLIRKWSIAPSLTGVNGPSSILPIHQACKMEGITIQFLERLIFAYPQSISKADSGNRRLPLHIAIRARAPDDVIFYILDKHPEGVMKQDFLGRLPLHYAISNHLPLNVILKLMSMCPATTLAVDKAGWTPLHVAASRARSATMVDTLVQCCPGAVVMLTRMGNKPKECAEMSEGPDRDPIIAILEEEEQRFEETPCFKNFRDAENLYRNQYKGGATARFEGVYV